MGRRYCKLSKNNSDGPGSDTGLGILAVIVGGILAFVVGKYLL